MATTLPPDPYLALGVSRNTDAATIKSTYRKLVLKCHPDKVTDESLKAQKQEEFHKIQQAYELIGDEEKRAIYDAEVKLEQLRKDRPSRSGGPSVEVKTAHYDVRTQAPAGASASFGARGPTRYDVPKSRSYDDYYERSRKYDVYDSYKHASPRTSRSEREKDTVRPSRATPDRTRSDDKKSRDKEERRERTGKYGPFVHMEDESSSGDDKVRFEGSYKRRNEEEEARKVAAEARRKADESRRSYDNEPRRHRSDDDDLRKYKISSNISDAMNYIGRAKGEAETRPSPGRNGSSRDVRPEYYVRKSDRPEAVRRSSAARPKDRPSSSGRETLSERIRDRIPEIVEWGDREERRMPSMSHSKSSPAEIHVPSSRSTPQRSYTTESASRDSRRGETSPTPAIRRAETSPAVHTSSSSRRKEASASRPSGLRNSETAPHDSGYSSSSPPLPSYPSVPPSTTRKVYHYPTPGGGVSLRPEDVGVANGHRAVYREPGRATSPTPLSRPPMGPNRPSATVNLSPSRGRDEERGRSRKPLYGEVPREPIRENRQPSSFSPERVQYTKKIGPEDIRWSGPRGRDAAPRDREYAKPTMSRSATYVY